MRLPARALSNRAVAGGQSRGRCWADEEGKGCPSGIDILCCAGQSFRMDVDTTNKIERLLADLNTGALKAFHRQALTAYASDQSNVFGDRSSAITGSMANQMARLAEENAMKLITDATSKVASISTAPDAFVLIDAAIMAHIMMLESEVEKGRGIPLSDALLQIFSERFEAIRQRTIRSLELRRSSFTNSKNQGGRPPTHDWEGAIVHITMLANTPDGLPEGQGAQAKIEGFMRDWFIQETGDAPSESEIRKRARRVIERLKTGFHPLSADTRPDS